MTHRFHDRGRYEAAIQMCGMLPSSTNMGENHEAAGIHQAHRIAIVDTAAPVTCMSETSNAPGGFFQALFNELRRSGYIEGQSLLVERYSGQGRAEHYPDLARDVVSRNPDVIIAISNNLVL